MAALKFTLQHLAAATAIAVVFRTSSWISTPALPPGFTLRGILGFSLSVGGIYNYLSSLIEYGYLDFGSIGSNKPVEIEERLRLVRWGVGGVGMFFAGFYMLLG